MSELTINDVLDIIYKQAQWCRENGESDMRNILNTVRFIRDDISKGKTRDEILASLEPEEDFVFHSCAFGSAFFQIRSNANRR